MTLYGYFYCSCIYESAPGLMSLHLTKAGAWRAMRKKLWDDAVNSRNGHLQYGQFGAPDAYIEPDWVRHTIQPIEVQP